MKACLLNMCSFRVASVALVVVFVGGHQHEQDSREGPCGRGGPADNQMDFERERRGRGEGQGRGVYAQAAAYALMSLYLCDKPMYDKL